MEVFGFSHGTWRGRVALKSGGFSIQFDHGALQQAHIRNGNLRVKAISAPVKQERALQYRKLGDSDLLISEVTLGTMTWGNQNTEKEAHEQLSYAFDRGVNIFDTSEVYPIPMTKETQGNTDRCIASWLKSKPRDKVIIATKVSGYSRMDYVRDQPGTVRVDGNNIKESVDKSLLRLGVDYIDLLQIHWPDRYVPLFGEYFYDISKWRPSVPIAEQLQGLQEVIQAGKVRYVGVSNETAYGVMEFLHAAKSLGLPKIVSIQNSYSLLVRCNFEGNLVEVCCPQHGNVGFLAYSPLAGGVLSGKYLDPSTSKTGRLHLFPGYMGRYLKSFVVDATREYVQVAKRHGLTPVELALGFTRDRPFLTSTIIGATTLTQLKENLAAFGSTNPLSKEVTDDIESVFKRFRDPTL